MKYNRTCCSVILFLFVVMNVGCGNKGKSDDLFGILLLAVSSVGVNQSINLTLNLSNANALAITNTTASASVRATTETSNLYAVDANGNLTIAISGSSQKVKIKKIYPGTKFVYLWFETNVKFSDGNAVRNCALARSDLSGNVTCVDFDLAAMATLPNSNSIQTKNSDTIQVDANGGIFYYGVDKFAKTTLKYASPEGVIKVITLPDSRLQYFYITSGNELIISHIEKSTNQRYLSILSDASRLDVSNLSTNTWAFQRSSGTYLLNPGLPNSSTDDQIKEYNPTTKALTTKIHCSNIPNYDEWNSPNFVGRLQDIKKVLEIDGVTYFYSTHESSHVSNVRRHLGNLYKFTSDTTLDWLPIGADSNNITMKSIEAIEVVGGNKVLVWGYTTTVTNTDVDLTVTQTKSDSDLALKLFDVGTKTTSTIFMFPGERIMVRKMEYSPALNKVFILAVDYSTNKQVSGYYDLNSSKYNFEKSSSLEITQVAPIR
ncbi:hypothetical protein [Leptospira sp. 'Mane']|uniref:hypothetical protein n=1 Tax=Leptospira sp. 'Mane' TaxID=3387407 RepID=UPI00398BA1B8